MLARISARTFSAPLILCCFAFICAPPCPAQQDDVSLELRPVAEPDRYFHMFDQYHAVNEEDEMARLDNFAIELQGDPKLKGYIIFYHGQNELPGRLMQQRGERALDYLMNTRGLDESRISLIKGGFREEQTTELWVIPESAPAPEPVNTITYVKPTGRTYQFDEQVLDVEYVDPGLEAGTEEGVEAESDAASTDAQDAAGSEPVEEQVENADDLASAKQEALDSLAPDISLRWASEQYADALKQEDGARACIIYYAYDEHMESELQAVIERGKVSLVSEYGLNADSFVVIYGGYRDMPTVDTWVVPANADLPAPTPEEKKRDTDEPEEEVIDPQPS